MPPHPPSISQLKPRDGLSSSDLRSIAQHARGLGSADFAELEATIRLDVQSEFDARFLAEYLDHQDWDLSPELRGALDQWLQEEELHQSLFRQVYGAAFPDKCAKLSAELLQRDQDVAFEPLQHLMRDEFEVLCLLAYDELATVKAYQALLPQYLMLGPSMGPLLKRVIRDEGRHYATFARILREQHADRLSETPALIEKIRASEGMPYANTFVLDHDYGVWTDSIFDRSVEQLKRALGQSSGATA
ncbi:MAG: hypothetical protein P1V35_12825 [Planctomycetota bacterium]|nr:hypothetical protein [Planctomycetota bacterium]